MWQNGKKCVVILSFDFDAESPWMAKNLKSPSGRNEKGHILNIKYLTSDFINSTL